MNRYDVIVVGGGPGGICAALGAARTGARTLLIEKYGFLGGMSTNALVYPWMTFQDKKGNQVIKGIGQEIVDRLIELGGSPGHVRDTIGFTYYNTPYDHEIFKILVSDMLKESGVDLLLHSLTIAAKTTHNRITSVTIATEYGEPFEIYANQFIDATGGVGLIHLAGGSTQKGRREDQATQPMTMCFRLGDVDLKAVKDYMIANPQDFYKESLIEELEHLPLTGVLGFYSIWEKYGPPEIPRDQVLFFIGLRPGQVFVNTGRVIRKDPTSLLDVIAAEIEGRTQTWDLVKFLKAYVPGFQNAYLIETGAQIGIRESRRLVGQYILSAEDVMYGKRFDNVIARNGYPVDIHDPTGRGVTGTFLTEEAYDIPFESILPHDLENVLVAGRAISCDEQAFSSMRTTPTCMAIGHAAGVAAALSCQYRQSPQELSIKELQRVLLNQGAELGI